MGCAQSQNKVIKKMPLQLNVEDFDSQSKPLIDESEQRRVIAKDYDSVSKNIDAGFGKPNPSPQSELVRIDLTQMRLPQTPKNEISLMKLTEELLSYLKQMSTKKLNNQSPFERMQDLILTNQFKTENHLDELAFCKYVASHQIVAFGQDPFFVDLFIQIVLHLKEVYALNKLEIKSDNWYFNFSGTLIKEVVDFIEPLQTIHKNEKLLRDYSQSEEMVLLYACILAILRFLEGISWGYSPMLMHQELDKEMIMCLKVTLNQLYMIRQNFRENPQLSEILNQKDIASIYFPRESFVNIQSIDQLICVKFGQNPYVNTQYLSNQVFRKTYVSIKRSIDDWLRLKNMKSLTGKKGPIQGSKDLICIQELIQYRYQYKSLTKNQIRNLKRPPKIPSRKLNQNSGMSQYTYSSVNLTHEQKETSNNDVEDTENQGPGAQIIKGSQNKVSEYCPYEIENSKQFLVIMGDSHEQLRVIVESFLQANLKIRTKYKCCVLHQCTEENSQTCDSYYIVKNIMRQILSTLPFLQNYLLISESHEFSQIISELMSCQEEEDSHLTQQNYPDIFVRFVKKINEIRLDFNVVVFITAIEYAFDQSDLQNIVYLLRSASVYLNENSFLKFIITMKNCSEVELQMNDYGQSAMKTAESVQMNTILKILQTGAICKLDEQHFFQKDGKNFLEFAFGYLYPDEETENLVDEAMKMANQSYHGIVEIVHRCIEDEKVKPIEVIKNFKTFEQEVQEAVDKIMEKSGLMETVMMLTLLVEIRGPIPTLLVKRFLKIDPQEPCKKFFGQQQVKKLDLSDFETLTKSQKCQDILNFMKRMETKSSAEYTQNNHPSKFNYSSDDLILQKYLEERWQQLKASESDQCCIQPRDVNLLRQCLFKLLQAHLPVTDNTSLEKYDQIKRFVMVQFHKAMNQDHIYSADQNSLHQILHSMLRDEFRQEVQSLFRFQISNVFCHHVENLENPVSQRWLFRPDIIFLMIRDIFYSFRRYIVHLTKMAQSNLETENAQNIFEFVNILYNIEQTLCGVSRDEPFTYEDFRAQLGSRILRDKLYMSLLGTKNDQEHEALLKTFEEEEKIFFKGLHHALRENQRIELIKKLPGCFVLAIKFFGKNQIYISMSNGLILAFDIITQKVEKIIANKGAIIDCMKILGQNFLVTAGIDSKIRLWNIQTEKLFAKYELNKYAIQHLIIFNQNLYSYGGHDMKLVKFDIATKETDCWINLKSHITTLKLLKYRSKEESSKSKDENRLETTESVILNETRIAAAFHDFDVVLYDLDLNQIHQINLVNMTPGDEVIRIIRTSDTEIMCFSNEGTINVLSIPNGLEEQKSGTIFSLKNEDYIDLLLIKSREFFLFTIERQKIEFYSANSLKRTDSWDYFFQNDLICCSKNHEGSKIFVGDKSCNFVLFNFMKHLDSSREKQIPSNRRQDPVVSIEVTSDPRKTDEQHQIISCSQDRDLRIWNRRDGLFNKKYDLSSFLAENVQCIKLGKNEENLFLGSKDMNVYLINIQKGKLCVVYEGHWNKVTAIYSVPQTDILITLSESNIKVWDLEYDECIKNMNEHSSLVVYIQQLKHDEQQVMTIGEQFELKIWNYVTGKISQQHEIDLGMDRKSKRNLQVQCCDVQEEMAFIALNDGQIYIYSIGKNKVLNTLEAWQNEEIIFIRGVKTLDNNYILIVYRTASILYQILPDEVKRICAYQINPRKCPSYKKSSTKYSSNSRFYFTSARVELLFDEDLIEKIKRFNDKINDDNLIIKYIRQVKGSQSLEQFFTHVENSNDETLNEYQLNSRQNQTELSLYSKNSVQGVVNKLKSGSTPIRGEEEGLIEEVEQEEEQKVFLKDNLSTNKRIQRHQQMSKIQQEKELQQKGVRHSHIKSMDAQPSLSVESQNFLLYLEFLENYMKDFTQSQKLAYIKTIKKEFMTKLIQLEFDGRNVEPFKVLVCIGDSKGQIHMLHLNLE